MKITTYKEAVDYLENFIGKSIYRIDSEYLKHHDPLEKTRALLNLLGNPQNKFASVLIGGTAGKGSTAYLISHILTNAGYKTGLTISPHLQKINERIQINNKQISNAKFVELASSIVRTIELMKKTKVGGPSYFEILIAMAFKYFCDQEIDIAVVEVGMGGEYDSTNTLYPLVAVLTNVNLDHTNILGKTVQKIARTKVGIIKGLRIRDKGLINNSSLIIHYLPVVTGIKQPSVIKIIEERCEKVGANLFRLGKDFDFRTKRENYHGSVFDTTILGDRIKKLYNLQLSLLGRHQVENASLAIETVLQLEKFGLKVSEENIRKALKTAFFPGRFEVIPCHPKFISGSFSPSPVPSPLEGEGQGEGKMLKQVQHDNEATLILDGAHNPTKMKAFLSTLKKLYPKSPKIFVIAFKSDKNIKGMLRQILRVADKIIITEFHGVTDMSKKASADALDIKNQILKIKKDTGVTVEKDSKKALAKALAIKQFNNSAIVIVTGSFYLVGEVRDYLGFGA